MAYYVATDSGGTKNETILFDETGHILLRDVSPGGNAMDLGVEEVARRVLATLRRVQKHIPSGVPDQAFLGVSSVIYYHEQLTDLVDKELPGWKIHWEDGGPGMMSSLLDQRDGGCLVCGTGTSLFLRNQGEVYHIGGLGYLVDTRGSGYWLGQQALLAAFKYKEERGEETVLYDLICKQMGKPLEDAIPDIYAGGRAYIASFARNVFTGRNMGDKVCRDIFEQGSRELAELTWAAESHSEKTVDIIMSGGIFLHYPEYVQAVISKSSPKFNMVPADVAPIFGCVKEAVWHAGGVVDEAFKQKFRAEYEAIVKK